MPRWAKRERSPLGNIRVNAGYSREAAAVAMNLSLSTIVRYENGGSDIPIGIAEGMAILFNVSFDELRNAIKATKKAKGVPVIGHHTKALPIKG